MRPSILPAAGKVTLTLKHGTHTLVSKRVTFTRAGKRTVVLRLSNKRAAGIRHARKLTATLTAALSGTTATKVTRRCFCAHERAHPRNV